MGVRKLIRVKQDINFLDKPLWFQNLRHDGLGFVWTDIEGYEYRSDYHPPDKVDILILLYLMYKSEHTEYQSMIEVTKYEILKECGFSSGGKYYSRVEESLKRWNSVAIYFSGTFYDGKEYHEIGFHVINKYEIDKKERLIKVYFNADWITKIKESKYYKYINFGYYRALKRPLSRRLHEWLSKSFIARNTCFIGLVKLGKRLTLSGEEVRTRKGTKRSLYASHVLQKIKPAINEINQLAHDPEIIAKTGIKPQDLFTVSYKITGKKQERVIHFTRHAVCFAQSKEKAEELNELLAMLPKRPKKLEAAVAEYHQQQGYEYVKWNILYANQKAQKNYAAYLKKALAENWAEEWAAEERARISENLKDDETARRKALAERARELEEQRAHRERPLFLEEVAKLDTSVKCRLWDTADGMVPEQVFRRENLIKCQYLGLLWQHLNENGADFCKAIGDDLRIAFELTQPSQKHPTQRE